MHTQPAQQWYYRIAYFLVANQVVFKRLVVVLLILLNIIIWWKGGVRVVNYLSTIEKYNKVLIQLTENEVAWQNYHLQNKPRDLEIISVDKIRVEGNKYDLVAKVRNSNSAWQIQALSYAFEVDGFITDWQTNFISPASSKYLFHFSYISPSHPDQVDLKISHISWQRVRDKNKIDILGQIVAENEKFKQDKNISQVQFDAFNNSYFSFWQIGWQIVLYQGKRPVAVNYVTTHNFLSGQSRQVSVAWSEALSSPAKIEIIPEINVFDDKSYMSGTDTSPVNLIKGAKDESSY